MDLPFYREYELPWTTGKSQEKRFQRLLGIVFLIALVLGIAWPFIPAPEPDPAEIIEMIPAAFRSRVVPALGSSFCSLDRANEWETFVVSHAKVIPGYERTLAQSLESVRLCAGLKEAKAEELLTAFASYEN